MMTLFQALAAALAFLAAFFWLWASLVPIPSKLTQIIVDDETGFEGELVDLFTGASKQSRWNARAAFCAALAAVLEGIVLAHNALN
jgi:hypothetical protein